jgi:cell wall-associated NlpC family hydrolase
LARLALQQILGEAITGRKAMSQFAKAIVRVARSKAGRQDWLFGAEKDNFAKNSHKCNQFVHDVMVEAGVRPLPVVPKRVFLTRPPTAGEWASLFQKINGWEIVTDPQPGDVVAEAADYSDATGHVGIVVGDKLTASASSKEGGLIVENDWGFRPENNPTFRRCTT